MQHKKEPTIRAAGRVPGAIADKMSAGQAACTATDRLAGNDNERAAIELLGRLKHALFECDGPEKTFAPAVRAIKEAICYGCTVSVQLYALGLLDAAQHSENAGVAKLAAAALVDLALDERNQGQVVAQYRKELLHEALAGRAGCPSKAALLAGPPDLIQRSS